MTRQTFEYSGVTFSFDGDAQAQALVSALVPLVVAMRPLKVKPTCDLGIISSGHGPNQSDTLKHLAALVYSHFSDASYADAFDVVRTEKDLRSSIQRGLLATAPQQQKPVAPPEKQRLAVQPSVTVSAVRETPQTGKTQGEAASSAAAPLAKASSPKAETSQAAHPRAIQFITSEAWAIRHSALQRILEIAERESGSLEAVQARAGRKLDNTRVVTVRDGVAVIPVAGPIFRYANLFTEVSGATSVEVLGQDFNTALEDPAVKSILFVIDSPGGQVRGINELSNMIFEARARKPIKAYVDGDGASAAYWIASAADEIIIDDTAILGSIGVVMVVPDPSKRARDLEIVSSRSPKKRIDPMTEAGKAEMQREVDALADVFIRRVARNRAVSEETVVSKFGSGGVEVGKGAIKAGLADRLGSFEDVLLRLQGRKFAAVARTAADRALRLVS